MNERLEDDGMDFDEVSQTLEQDESKSLSERAKDFGEDLYDFAREAIGPTTAVTVPAGAGLAALTNQPVEVGAGAGVSASMLYEAAKHQRDTDYEMDLEGKALLGGLAALGPAGGYAASKRDELSEYAQSGVDAAADTGQDVYQAAVEKGVDVANYAMTEGPQMANDAAASAGETALGLGAGFATIVGGALAYGKVKDMATEDRDWER
ncbi:MAG: hypothetical protein ACI977_000299 [Candidatus Nanohaloarchaea archaeon]|jgi:hypothetical protein